MFLMKANADQPTLEAALIGYEVQLRNLREKIAELRLELQGGGAHAPNTPKYAPRPKSKMGTAARKRIAAAQKKRWAAYHQEYKSEVPEKKTAKKRTLSPTARKRISDATKKRWAAYRAGQAAQS